MPPRYTNYQRIESHLGEPLTAAQQVEANRVALVVDEWLDGLPGRTWAVSADPILEERHTVLGPLLYLKQRPVAVLTEVRLRPPYVNVVDTVLVAGVGYSLRDASRGEVRLSWFPAEWDALVTYTPAVAVPAPIEFAATLAVLHYLRPIMDGVAPGIKSYSIGQELEVEYADTATTLGLPLEVTTLLAPWMSGLVFA